MRMVIAMFGSVIGMGVLLLIPMCGTASAASTENNPAMNDTTPQARYSASGHDITPLPRAEVEVLASRLDEETYRITQKAGTEPAFCGTLLDNKKNGVYTCVVCGLPLFSSEHKFNSGSGWPSFFQPVDEDHVATEEDTSLGMVRTEINCARCGSHLGHVFPDGPPPTGTRHCLNSASLVFYENGQDRPEASMPVKTETAYFAGGCFWGVEHYFQMGDGVLSAESGYMQGDEVNPTYEEILEKKSRHAETVKVVFDPGRISYERLLEAFFVMHDPTQVDRQGPDFGPQYRSGLWFATGEQKAKAEAYIASIEGRYTKPIATEVAEAKVFYLAEAYHQDYIANTGRACHVTNPWTEDKANTGG